jgi:hypothetical protein
MHQGPSKMPLNGALLNHHEHLARLNALRKKLLSQAAVSPRPAKEISPRSGVVQDAVIQVLTTASEPMHVRDIRASVAGILSMHVSKSTVNSFLSVGARGPNPRFQRVAPGVYRLS